MIARTATVIGLALTLSAPAAARAATFIVDPAATSGACSASDTRCSSIAKAVSAAAAGDTISILKGTYAESVSVPDGKDGLKIAGAATADVKITGSGTGDVVTIASRAVTLSGISVDVPANGQSAVRVAAAGARLDAVLLQRTAPSGENVPVVDVTDAGAAEMSASYVVQGAGTAGTPAIRSTGGGFVLADTVVVSSTGPALVIESSDGNRVLRSTLASTQPDSDAVRVLSADGGKRALIVDSSIMIGGAKAAGLLARSTSSDAADIALQVRHATIAGSAKGIVLDASGANGPALPPAAAGSIDAKVFSSIVHGTSEARRHAPTIPGVTSTANSASLTFADSDAPPPGAGNGTVQMGNATFTEDERLFAPKSLKLRPDAPVIDRGGPLQSGESATDVDGDPREVDGPDADTTPQSDIGADEYVNLPPKAVFGITNPNPRQNEAVGFISGSTDPEQGSGGGIVEYRWDFGDGTRQTGKAAGVAHAYTRVGTYRATLQVVDAQGLVSAVAAQDVVVKDGILPEVTIGAPVDGARLNLRSTYLLGRKRPKPRQLTLRGKVFDASGIEAVEVTLYSTRRDPVRRARLKRTARGSQAVKLCEFYSGRVFSKKDCTKEIWLKATLVGNDWTLKTKKGLRLPAGLYEARVRAKDASGLLTTAFSTTDRTLVTFRVR